MKKRGQQEIAGFVVIVVLVVIAALIFMVLSLGNREVKNDSVEVGGLLSALLEQTSECIVQEPLPLNVGELVKETYGGVSDCKNLKVTTRSYLNETIYNSMENVMKIETRFKAWQIDIYLEEDPIGRFYNGNCENAQMIGADRIVGDFRVELSVCLNSYD